MAYKLEGRALCEDFTDNTVGSCIFCGELISHINGDGDKAIGLIVNSCEEGEARSYLYCEGIARGKHRCPQGKADDLYEHSMWFCGCQPDYIDVIGKKCPSCGTTSAAPADICGDKAEREYVYTAELRYKTDPGVTAVQDALDKLRDVTTRTAVLLVSSDPHIGYPKGD